MRLDTLDSGFVIYVLFCQNGGVLEKGLSSGDPGHRYIEMVYGENVACKLCDLLAEVQYVLPSLRVVWQRGAGSQRALMA